MDLESVWAQRGSFGLVVNEFGIITQATSSASVIFDTPCESIIGTPLASWVVYTPTYAIKSARGNTTRVRFSVSAGPGPKTMWFESNEDECTLRIQSERYADDLKQLEFAVSHDLMEPIRMIGGYLSLYVDDEKNGRTNPDYLTKAQGAVTVTRGFLTDFVQYLRLDSRHRESATLRRINLNELVYDVLQSLHLLVQEANAEITYTGLPTVRGDGRMFYQVFSNLITNALKYRDPSRPCKITLAATETDDAYTITVTDNGRGIHPSKTERVFAPFVRGHKDVPGSGIGLAIVKRCLEYHSASIHVTSKLGHGSVFAIELPKRRDQSETAVPTC